MTDNSCHHRFWWRWTAANALAELLGLRAMAALAYFGLAFGTAFVLDAVRVPFLVPRLGMRVAELIEMPFMLVAIVPAILVSLPAGRPPAS